MSQFYYKALTKAGTISTGELEATDRAEGLRLLQKRGLQTLNLTENRVEDKKSVAIASPKKDEVPSGSLKLKNKDIILFTEELSDMLGAGLQLEPALRAMENRQELGALKAVSEQVREIVCDGVNFSTALKKVSSSFGPLYCSLAAAGEASGALDTILKRQAHYLRTLEELRSRLILAMIYPSFLIIAGIGVAIIMVTMLIPQMASLIQDSPGGKLPLMAVVLMAISNFIVKWWIFIIGFMIGGGLLFKAWKENPDNFEKWDSIKLKLPLIGKVIEARFYVQFLETLANLVGNGLPLLRGIELARDAVENRVLRHNLDRVIAQVGDGRAFSKALIRTETFPPLLIDMIAVGEQTGKLDQSIRRAAERYDKELDKNIQRIMALVMPVVLIIMAALIGTMAYLMVSGIFQTMEGLEKAR